MEGPNVGDELRGQWPMFTEIGHVLSHVYSFCIDAVFICMHQTGKNKRIRACVSGALLVIQFVARQSSSPTVRDYTFARRFSSAVLLPRDPRSFSKWMLAFDRETVALFSFQKDFLAPRHVTSFPFSPPNALILATGRVRLTT